MVCGKPEITVCMVVHCRDDAEVQYLQVSLGSLVEQDFKRFEVILINNASPCPIKDVIGKYAENIVYMENRQRESLAASCNRALSMAGGRFFVRFDGDDLALPGLLSTLYNFSSEQPAKGKIVAYVSSYIVVDMLDFSTKVVNPNSLGSLQACGNLYPTAILKMVGGYRDFFWEEHDLHLRLQHLGGFAYLGKVLWVYRKRRGSLTADAERCREGWKELERVWGKGKLIEAFGKGEGGIWNVS